MKAADIANRIKKIIDDMWAQEIDEQEARRRIMLILEIRENRIKVIRGKEKTAVFVRIMGIKRMKSFDELIDFLE